MKVTYRAPAAVQQYNKYRQGVDRLDQLRARFSITDEPAWKDVVQPTDRDPHRRFIENLCVQLIKGDWKIVPNGHEDEVSSISSVSSMNSTNTGRILVVPSALGASNRCVAQPHKPNVSRRKKYCIVCKWEGRPRTQSTLRDVNHHASLCVMPRTVSTLEPVSEFFCPNSSLTCWDKFHAFYLKQNLFSANGLVRTSSPLYVRRVQSEGTGFLNT